MDCKSDNKVDGDDVPKCVVIILEVKVPGHNIGNTSPCDYQD